MLLSFSSLFLSRCLFHILHSLQGHTNREPHECRFGTVILVLTVAQVILSIAQVVASF